MKFLIKIRISMNDRFRFETMSLKMLQKFVRDIIPFSMLLSILVILEW